MISVLDYGCGNIGSIVNMLRRVGQPSTVIRTPEEVLRSQKLILPGVGAFDTGITYLRQGSFQEALEERVLRQGIPLLGVCLGMQLLLEASEEGQQPGLGWVPGRAVRFQFAPAEKLRVPHMGWTQVHAAPGAKLFEQTDEPSRFYFAHSYRATQVPESWAAAHADYGGRFVCALQKDNIYATQFHPEKSHRHGMELLKRFAENGNCSSPA